MRSSNNDSYWVGKKMIIIIYLDSFSNEFRMKFVGNFYTSINGKEDCNIKNYEKKSEKKTLKLKIIIKLNIQLRKKNWKKEFC